MSTATYPSSEFRRLLLLELQGMEVSLLRTGDIFNRHAPASVDHESGLFWLSSQAAVAELRISDAIPVAEAIADAPPLYSNRVVNESWPDVRGAVIWNRYMQAIARDGITASIPYRSRELHPSGPELIVLVATLARDIEVIRAFLNIGLVERTEPFTSAVQRAANVLARPPFADLYSRVKDLGANLNLPISEALERLERGRAWSPAAPALYGWIRKWLSGETDEERLREVALRGEGLDDRLFELWCAKKLFDAIGEELPGHSQKETLPVYERYIRGYRGHGEIFTITWPKQAQNADSKLQLRIHFQRPSGVLSKSSTDWDSQPSISWKRKSSAQASSGSFEASPIIPDLIISLSRVDATGRLWHARSPILADPKNRVSTGSDERLKMLGYLQATTAFAKPGKVQLSFLFVRDPALKKAPVLHINRDRVIVGTPRDRSRSGKAVYELPVEPGSARTDAIFKLASRTILHRFGIRNH